jgi:hypothetical protein
MNLSRRTMNLFVCTSISSPGNKILCWTLINRTNAVQLQYCVKACIDANVSFAVYRKTTAATTPVNSYHGPQCSVLVATISTQLVQATNSRAVGIFAGIHYFPWWKFPRCCIVCTPGHRWWIACQMPMSAPAIVIAPVAEKASLNPARSKLFENYF